MMIVNKDPASKAFELLICEMLRGSHIESMNSNELKEYTYRVGVAIRNIPHFISKGIPLDAKIVRIINNLDPASNNGQKWGGWVKNIVPSLIPKLPVLNE